MEYKVLFDINRFQFWSGAKDVFVEIYRQDRVDELEQLIEDYLGEYETAETMPTDTSINDFVWFDVPDLMNLYDKGTDDEEEE